MAEENSLCYPSWEVSGVDRLPKKQSQENGNLEPLWTGEGAVLVVEDCEPLLFYLNSALLRLGFFKQYLASTLAEASAAWTQHHHEIRHVLLNYGLPDGNGCCLASRIIAENPGMNIIITTGGDLPSVLAQTRDSHLFSFLQKPFLFSELKEALRKPRLPALALN